MTKRGDVFPPPLQEAENDRLKERWKNGLGQEPPADGWTGVGVSGGGIRSATFALGFFQGLAGRGLVRYVDYLSTVSGGGYFGSFLGRLFTRKWVRSPEQVEKVLLRQESPEVLAYLRENGRYLSPNGGGDSLLFGAALLRNWVAIQLVLLIFLLTIFLGLQGLAAAVEMVADIPQLSPEGLSLWWSPFFLLPIASFVICVFPLGWAYWLVEPLSGRQPPERAPSEGGRRAASRRESSSRVPPAAGVLVVLLLCAAVVLFAESEIVAWTAAVGGGASLLALVYWQLARLRTALERKAGRDQPLFRSQDQRNRLSLWLTHALVFTFLLAVLGLVDTLGQSLYVVVRSGDMTVGRWLAGLAGSLGLASLGRWLAMFFSKGPQGARAGLPYQVIATVVAVLLIGAILVAVDGIAQAVAWGWKIPAAAPKSLQQAVADESQISLDARPGTSMTLRIDQPPAEPGGEDPPAKDREAKLLLAAFAGCFLVSILFGQTWPFVNRSSHLPLYGARLTRAYLGASNPERFRGESSVTEPLPDDDLDLAGYWRDLRSTPERGSGAPIHLINVTINETIDAVSQVQQQDRKGLAFALGPCAFSVGLRHHMMMDPAGEKVEQIFPDLSRHRVFRYQCPAKATFTGDDLSLGSWLAISGAAFSTGTGMRTSLGISLLAGFGNIRLGFWWDSGLRAQSSHLARKHRKLGLRIEDALAKFFPVQIYLLDEFLARFPGTARRHWYLSDGGHFENMGGYELIRRRLPFMLILDAEQDADYRLEGLANLVRKARLDFHAEIRFLTLEQLDAALGKESPARAFVGTLDQLRRGSWTPEKGACGGPSGKLDREERSGFSLAYAALAQVEYADTADPSWLLYVKPALTGCEPIDLLEYHSSHADFPHESTVDQFFDEAQWESYRRLGEHIATQLFEGVKGFVKGTGPTLIRNWELPVPPDSCPADEAPSADRE